MAERRTILEICGMDGLNPNLSGDINTLEERLKGGSKGGKSVTLESTEGGREGTDGRTLVEGGSTGSLRLYTKYGLILST